MKNENQSENESALRALLGRARPAPALPPRFQEGVWRRIAKAEAPVELGWLERLLAPFLRSRFALASLAAMLLLSTVAGLMDGTASARQAAQARYLSAVAPNTVR
jgi:hypothetical protein